MEKEGGTKAERVSASWRLEKGILVGKVAVGERDWMTVDIFVSQSSQRSGNLNKGITRVA